MFASIEKTTVLLKFLYTDCKQDDSPENGPAACTYQSPPSINAVFCAYHTGVITIPAFQTAEGIRHCKLPKRVFSSPPVKNEPLPAFIRGDCYWYNSF